MFDRTIIESKIHEYVPYDKTVNVTEKRAPTDESLKLLKEMHKEVVDSIIGTYSLSGCPIDNIAFHLQPDYMSAKETLVIKFNLAGKDIITHIELDHFKMRDEAKRYDYIADRIKEVMTKSILDNILKYGYVRELPNLFRK